MPVPERRVRVKAFAKVNLSLEVLGRRADGYHDLRTIFQTISLADNLDVRFTPGRRTTVELESNVDIANNLVVRAAEAILEASNAKGVARFRLTKRIPMGGGLGGGSTNAAAVLLALPALTGRPVGWERLLSLGASIGSDVPFFLLGGTALGLGRGTELYPLPDRKAPPGVLVTPGVHVSTPAAYQALSRPLTSEFPSPKINVSQRVTFSVTEGARVALATDGEQLAGDWSEFCSNDFESVVFRQYPKLGAIKRKLKRLGAQPALMTGSGSALFGLFPNLHSRNAALLQFRETAYPISFLSRSRYLASWRRQLNEHIEGNQWPPHSRHSR